MKIRYDFISNSSSCSFFVGLHTHQDIDEFKKLVNILKHKKVHMWLFCNLEDAHDRWYGEMFEGNGNEIIRLQPGNYILIDTGDDHYKGFEYKFWDIVDRFDAEYKFKLYNDKEAHMSTGDKLPKTEPKDNRTF